MYESVSVSCRITHRCCVDPATFVGVLHKFSCGRLCADIRRRGREYKWIDRYCCYSNQPEFMPQEGEEWTLEFPGDICFGSIHIEVLP